VIHRLIAVLVAWFTVLVAFPSGASAAVEVAFYSKEFGATFPHAFVTVSGVLDGTGERVDASYGFTAKSVSPAILMGSVAGEVVSSSPSYIARSERHFAFSLSDEEYRRLMATVETWRTRKQPSYNLNRRNCVFFVAELAAAVGMQVETPKGLMKKPYSFIRHLLELNRAWLQRRGASVQQFQE